MSKLNVVRTDIALPPEAQLTFVRKFLFECFEGFTEDDNKKWRRFWTALAKKEPGEMALIEMVFPRSGPFHKRHMKIEQVVFDAQERFTDFDMFLDWMKIGAGWVVWVPGPKGGIVPLVRSISYAKADENEFQEFHAKVMAFLRGPHAANYLWPHLKGIWANEMMNTILQEFNE